MLAGFSWDMSCSPLQVCSTSELYTWRIRWTLSAFWFSTIHNHMSRMQGKVNELLHETMTCNVFSPITMNILKTELEKWPQHLLLSFSIYRVHTFLGIWNFRLFQDSFKTVLNSIETILERYTVIKTPKIHHKPNTIFLRP